MYNVNNDEYLSSGEFSEVLEAVHECINELAGRQAKGDPYPSKFTDLDIRAVTVLYMMVVNNRIAYKAKEDGINMEFINTLKSHFFENINDITMIASGVNTLGNKKEKK